MIGLLVLYSCIDTQLLLIYIIKEKVLKLFFSREFAIMITINAFLFVAHAFRKYKRKFAIREFSRRI